MPRTRDEVRKQLERAATHRAGLGDAIAVAANPVARSIDWLLGTNLKGCAGCSRRREKLNEWGDRLRGWASDAFSGKPVTLTAVPLILENHQSPGDIVVMTGVVRALHEQYPGYFLTATQTAAQELWQNNPRVSPSDDGLFIPITYAGIHQSNQSGKHFMQAMADDLAAVLELPGLTVAPLRGDVHLSDFERDTYPFTPAEPYWLVCAGTKSDYTTKLWLHYAEVVASLRSKINFVQIGARGENAKIQHKHPPICDVAANLVGQTSHRELVHLVSHCAGVLCGVTYVMHLAASFQKPCIVLAGGREPVAWNDYKYDGFRLMHSIGTLDCCETHGCWKSRVVPLGDGDKKDKSLCLRPVGSFPKCLHQISPETVVELIKEAT